jgi:DNA-binding NarL/FixJ family response regulator
MREYGDKTAVVLDGQPLWLEAMEQLLAALKLKVVGKSTDPTDALDLIKKHRPDVVVVDYDIADGQFDAPALLRRARQTQPDLKIVVLSLSNEPEQIEAAFAAGAHVYCIKTADRDDLLVAVRQAFEHSIYLAQAAGGAVPAAAPADEAIRPDLTRREIEILQLVAEGHSNAQLARMLWVTEQTVKFHLSNIYRKLDVANRTEASRWAQLNGLLSARREITSAA